MVPAALLLTRRHEGQDGGGVDALAAGKDGQHWTRRDMLMHWRFWMLSGLIIAPSFSTTGLLFHQVYFAESKMIPFAMWISGYGIYAAFNIVGSFMGGGLTDRYTACRVAPIVVANMALSPLLLNFAAPGMMVFVFFAGFGIVQGMVYTSATPIWAEIYGTRHLGGIKAIAQALMVFRLSGLACIARHDDRCRGQHRKPASCTWDDADYMRYNGLYCRQYTLKDPGEMLRLISIFLMMVIAAGPLFTRESRAQGWDGVWFECEFGGRDAPPADDCSMLDDDGFIFDGDGSPISR